MLFKYYYNESGKSFTFVQGKYNEKRMKLLFLITLILVALAVLLLCVKLLLLKDGAFPNTHVGGQKAMQERGISCHTSQHRDIVRHRSLAERIEAQKSK